MLSGKPRTNQLELTVRSQCCLCKNYWYLLFYDIFSLVICVHICILISILCLHLVITQNRIQNRQNRLADMIRSASVDKSSQLTPGSEGCWIVQADTIRSGAQPLKRVLVILGTVLHL